jgi:hypothetical protein
MSLSTDRLAKLAGLNEESVMQLGKVFCLSEPSNMHKAIDAILEAGIQVDLAYSMGTFYFNFDSEKVAKDAHSVVSKVIDKKKELKWVE